VEGLNFGPARGISRKNFTNMNAADIFVEKRPGAGMVWSRNALFSP
jgi:hypothetical protein